MAKASSPIEFASFSKGLVTDASPLNYEPDSATTITNMDLNLDGSVSRRKGLRKILQTFDGIDSGQDNELYAMSSTLTTGISKYYDEFVPKLRSFLWEGAGGTNDTLLVFCNPGRSALAVYKFTSSGVASVPSVTGGSLINLPYEIANPNANGVSVDFANVGGKLVVVNGTRTILTLDYTGTIVTQSTSSIKVRDVWGVSLSTSDGKDLLSGDYLDYRAPATDLVTAISSMSNFQNYLYNIRNQGWAIPRYPKASEDLLDPSQSALTSMEALPSMSDRVVPFLYPNTARTANPTVDRFHDGDMKANSKGKQRAPVGHFIIDLMSRKSSREANRDRVRANTLDSTNFWLESVDTVVAQTLSSDNVSYGGPSTIASYAGRAWFAGIGGGGVTNKFGGSPDLTNLVLFSQLANSETKLTQCYQEGDPTSADDADLLDTDGGFVTIPELLEVTRLVPFKDKLLVIASNGVWSISGSDSIGFTAKSYVVNKVSNSGCKNYNSIVVTQDAILMLSEGSISAIGMTQTGELAANDITTNKIGKLIRSLNAAQRATFNGSYNERANIVTWHYQSQEKASSLKLNLDIGAFYLYDYSGETFGGGVCPIQSLSLPSTLSVDVSDNVVIGSDNVVVGGDQVVSGSKSFTNNEVDVLHIIQQYSSASGTQRVAFGFAVEDASTFNDWEVFPVSSGTLLWVTPTPTDAKGTILTGALTGGDTQRYKQVPYLTVNMAKTETGFEEVDGDIVPVGESSCKIRVIWEWTNLASSGRWGREFQAYRHSRFYMPDDLGDGFDNGRTVVTTKNKLRGKGRALSLLINTEPNKDMKLLGWALNIGITNEV